MSRSSSPARARCWPTAHRHRSSACWTSSWGQSCGSSGWPAQLGR